MEIIFSKFETQFLVNTLINQDVSTPAFDAVLARSIANKIIPCQDITFSQQEVGFLQYVLRTQLEILGSQRSTANEKQPTTSLSTHFFPHKSMVLIKKISDKLGAQLTVDVTTKSSQRVPRTEGSSSIMTDPNQSPVGIVPIKTDL